MYKTIKIRLKLTQQQKESLLLYECKFQAELNRIGLFLMRYPHSRFKEIKIASEIEKHTHWVLFQLALRKANQMRNGKSFTYNKSSSWSPKSTQVRDIKLILIFGCTFPMYKDTLYMVIERNQLLQLQQYEIVRVDLVHDEKYWFVNYLVNKL